MSAPASGRVAPLLAFRQPLDAARMQRARERIREYLHEQGCLPEAVEAVVLTVEEAMANAVRHSGAREDLEVDLHFEGADLIAEIRDHGCGFDTTMVDLEGLPDLTAPGGRGLFLMAQLMDDLEIHSNGGVEITAVKRDARAESPRTHAGRRWAAPGEAAVRDLRRTVLLDEIAEAVVAYDWEYRYVHLNAAALRLARMSREELIGRAAWEVHPESREMPQGAALREAMELGRFAILEYEAPTSGDWVETRFYPTSCGVTLVSHEINERKRRELEREELLGAVRAGEARIRHIAQAGRIGFFEYNASTDTAYWSPEHYELLGLEPGSTISWQRWQEGVHPDDRERMARNAARLLERGRSEGQVRDYRDEYRFIRPDGAVVWLGSELSLDVVDGETILRGSVRDITERRLAEEALQTSERRFRALFEKSPDAVLLTTGAGSTLAANQAACEMLGYTERELCALSRDDVFDTGDPRFAAALEDRARDGSVHGAELTAIRSGGERFPVEVDSVLLPGDPSWAFVVLRDISERKWLEAVKGQRNIVLEGITTILGAALDTPGEKELGLVCLGVAARLTGSALGFIGEVGSDGLLRDVVSNDPGGHDHAVQDPGGQRSPPGDRGLHELCRQVLATGAALVTNSPAEHLGATALIEGRPVLRAFLGVPISDGEATRAVIALGDREGGYGDEQLLLVEAIVPSIRAAFERRRAEEALREHARLTEALTTIDQVVHSSLDPDEIVWRALQEGGQALGADAAAVMAHEPGRFVVRHIWKGPAERLGTVFPEERVGEGLLALRTGRVVAVDDTAADPRVADATMDELGIDAIITAPLIVRDEGIAVLDFSHKAPHHFTRAEIDFVSRLGSSLSLALENARIDAERSQSARLAGALNAINRLVHSTLEVESIMQRALEEGTRTLEVDCAAIELRATGAWVLSYQHGFDPAEREAFLSDRDAPAAVRAAATTEAFAVADLHGGPQDVGFVARQRLRSMLAAPLITQGRTVGCLLFYGRTVRDFLPAELDFAGKLAATMSLALENARLYSEERNVALVLQASLVHPLPEVPGLELATLSVPAGHGHLVGGDFYDVVVRPDGLVVVLVGDVTGKGIRAAGFTETVRSAVRALAFISPAPGYILANVNRLLLAEDGHEQFATVLVVMLDPRSGAGEMASAGHPAAVLVSARGSHLIEPRYGLPLGVLERSYETIEFSLAKGDALVLYTDGLTEARRDGDLFGESRLLAVLGEASSRAPQELVDRLHESVVAFAGRLRDDLQIVALRRTEPCASGAPAACPPAADG